MLQHGLKPSKGVIHRASRRLVVVQLNQLLAPGHRHSAPLTIRVLGVAGFGFRPSRQRASTLARASSSLALLWRDRLFGCSACFAGVVDADERRLDGAAIDVAVLLFLPDRVDNDEEGL